MRVGRINKRFRFFFLQGFFLLFYSCNHLYVTVAEVAMRPLFETLTSLGSFPGNCIPTNVPGFWQRGKRSFCTSRGQSTVRLLQTISSRTTLFALKIIWLESAYRDNVVTPHGIYNRFLSQTKSIVLEEGIFSDVNGAQATLRSVACGGSCKWTWKFVINWSKMGYWKEFPRQHQRSVVCRHFSWV